MSTRATFLVARSVEVCALMIDHPGISSTVSSAPNPMAASRRFGLIADIRGSHKSEQAEAAELSAFDKPWTQTARQR